MDISVNTDPKQTLYPLVRDYIDAMGASRTTVIAIKSYMHSIRRLRCSDEEFKKLIIELNTVIRNTEPQIAPLVHIIEAFEKEIAPHFSSSLEAAKNKAVEILKHKVEQFVADTEKVTNHCIANISPNDFIIVHSPTAYLRNAFVRAHTEMKLPFKLLVLKQDFKRTKDLVNAMIDDMVDHLLIPEHNLSHYLSEVNKLFISALTITSDRKAVTGPGTANVVSICHSYNVPVYLFAESIKFSNRPIKDQHIYREEGKKMDTGYTFQMISFSHDYVDLAMVDYIITEKGKTDFT